MSADSGLAVEEAAEGRSGFTVTMEGFDGPFELLLSLIAKRQMDVTAVSLGEVTDEFIDYVRTLEADRALDESSQFVFVAATLLDMKLIQLLPGAQAESEGDIAALEARDLLFARLLQYRAFKQVAEQMGAAMQANAGRCPRRPGNHPEMGDLLPPLVWNTTAAELKALAERALARPYLEPNQVKLEHLHAQPVQVGDQIAVMTQHLKETGECGFGELIATAENRMVVVVRFLGLLELFRERQVEFLQPAPLGQLTVTWVGGEDPAAAHVAEVASAEWDRR